MPRPPTAHTPSSQQGTSFDLFGDPPYARGRADAAVAGRFPPEPRHTADEANWSAWIFCTPTPTRLERAGRCVMNVLEKIRPSHIFERKPILYVGLRPAHQVSPQSEEQPPLHMRFRRSSWRAGLVIASKRSMTILGRSAGGPVCRRRAPGPLIEWLAEVLPGQGAGAVAAREVSRFRPQQARDWPAAPSRCAASSDTVLIDRRRSMRRAGQRRLLLGMKCPPSTRYELETLLRHRSLSAPLWRMPGARHSSSRPRSAFPVKGRDRLERRIPIARSRAIHPRLSKVAETSAVSRQSLALVLGAWADLCPPKRYMVDRGCAGRAMLPSTG